MLKRFKAWLKPVKLDQSTVAIKISLSHPMVRMRDALDWDHLQNIAAGQRAKIKAHLGGPAPQTRALLGALLVHIMKSCTLRNVSDLIEHYAPARILCNLENSDWTPNFRTISDFELMLGDPGLKKINAYVLDVARNLGFADIKGLCADSTAQEAMIPHPTEVGLMGSFAKSIEAGVQVLGKKLGNAKFGIKSTIEKIKKHVRKYRLFAKTPESKNSLTKKIMSQTKKLLKLVRNIPAMTHGGITLKTYKKAKKKVIDRFEHLTDVLARLVPQIDYYVETGKVASGKIISLFLEGIYSIVRGKAGKKVEFGLKWGINQIRGGYISLFMIGSVPGEADYAVQAVKHHIDLFGSAPKEFGYDRGGWSEKHLQKIADLGVKKIAVAPKGKSPWRVGEKLRKKMVNERAQVEGKIGTLKSIGFNKPHVKSTAGMVRAAHRAEIRFNIAKLMRDCTQSSNKRSMKFA